MRSCGSSCVSAPHANGVELWKIQTEPLPSRRGSISSSDAIQMPHRSIRRGRMGTHMPIPVKTTSELKPGDYYEDCAYHPCLCVSSGEGTVHGISLVDGSFPRNCGIPQCGVRKLSAEEA